ncbi:hypothetical protein RV02_GL001198 [Enterococcus gilvus]|uniref:Uncharacterized protein n=1 Tax=Enterococcus gilvus ATCC BAA-350 TaxID=1158614 RepID=R2V424_9ENTE|nr:hypothetical protein UKC_04076 [Enterococcus gilvus ATCC BAA-350]EOW77160.1 hypothetical protein I592_04136 [Enterococcus gilvus ATCC BAA-350]OJG41111.1 hypothetical protein RV02_GL001198 [Enterococcus gilvus]
MNEVRELVAFMRSGKRKEILLEEYLFLRRKQKKWNKKREYRLLNQLEKSEVLSVGYQKRDDEIKKNLILHNN